MTDESPELTPAQIAARLRAIDERLDHGAAKMDQHASALAEMAGELKRNSDELKRNSETTGEVRELLDVGRNGLKVLGWLGNAAKWIGTLAGACLSLYACFYAVTHHGQTPPKP